MPKPEILNRTSADVMALYDRLSKGSVGDTITYDEMAEIIGRSCKPGSHGYPAQYSARKKCVRENGLVWEPLKDHSGLKCLDAKEVLMLSAKDQRRIGRGARRARAKLSCIDPTH